MIAGQSMGRTYRIGVAAWAAAALLLAGAAGTEAVAQIEMTIPDAGRIKTTAKVQNGILGSVTSLTRRQGVARQCVGACFYATTTKTKTWVCRERDCDLDCAGREPVGGCL